MKNQKIDGFTLIELLVVISIIGLLASVVLLALNNARLKAREVKRKSDIVQINEALQMYYQDDGHNVYPNGGTTGKKDKESDIQSLRSFLVPKYLVSIPNDPINNPNNYMYIWGNNGQDFGLFVPFGNDDGEDCMIKTAKGDPNWFGHGKSGKHTVPDCQF